MGMVEDKAEWGSGLNRRKKRALLVGGSQFNHLVSEYNRCVAKFGMLARSCRRLKLFSVALSGVFLLALFLVARSPETAVAVKGVSFTISELLMVYPLAHLCLLAHYAMTTYNKTKAQYESRVVDVAISRFGGITAMSALRVFDEYCTGLLRDASTGGYFVGLFTSIHRVTKLIYGVIVSSINLTAVAYSLALSLHLLSRAEGRTPLLLMGAYITITIFGTTSILMASLIAKAQKRSFLRKFVREYSMRPSEYLPKSPSAG